MIPTDLTRGVTNERDLRLLERAYDNIMKNVSPAEGMPWSPYRGITPGRNGAFPGVWNWDSAFHAMCVSRWDPALAVEALRAIMQYQRADGMFADVMQTNGVLEDTSSKPPVYATYVLLTYERGGDKDFLEEAFARLKKNVAFWESARAENGLFFYDAEISDPKARDQYARWESGWDDSVRWDQGILSLYPIDLQCYMVMFYRALATIAEILGESNTEWKRKELALTERINGAFYDEAQGIYTDVRRADGGFSGVYSPACFMPFYVGIASMERAERAADFCQKHFYPAMPTVAYDDPAYVGDYWRGHSWLNVAYFAIKGLKQYGFDALADDMKNTLLDFADKNGDGIYEKYDADTGEGKGCPCFGWSSAFLMEFILNC